MGAVPFGKWPIAGLRRAGATAPAVFEGAINGEMFPLAFTRLKASQTSLLGMSNGVALPMGSSRRRLARGLG